MKTQQNGYIQATITFVQANFCLAVKDENIYFLPRQTGPVTFDLDSEGHAIFGSRFLSNGDGLNRGAMVVINPGKFDREHKKTPAINWGLLVHANEAERNYVKPTTFVVYRRQRKNKGRWSAKTEAFRGSVDQMIQRFSRRDGQRWSATDQLAPIHETVGGFVFENTFGRLEGDHVVISGDPRPLDKTGPQYRVVRSIAGCEPRGLAAGSLAEITFEYPRLKRGQDTLRDGDGIDIIWYRQGSHGEWTVITTDPRPIEKSSDTEGDQDKKTIDLARVLADSMVGKFDKAA